MKLADHGRSNGAFPEERWDEIVAEYQAGVSAYALAKKHGLSDSTVERRLRARGIEK